MQINSNALKTVCIAVLFISTQACSSSRKSSGNNNSGGSPSGSVQKKYARLLDVSPADITNKELYAFIEKWIDTRYKYGGQSRNGIDCSGLIQLLYDEVYHIKLPRSSRDMYDAANTFTARRKLEEGDPVFFKTSGNKITHVGIYLQNNKFLNSTTQRGVIISSFDEEYWDNCYAAGGRIR